MAPELRHIKRVVAVDEQEDVESRAIEVQDKLSDDRISEAYHSSVQHLSKACSGAYLCKRHVNREDSCTAPADSGSLFCPSESGCEG